MAIVPAQRLLIGGVVCLFPILVYCLLMVGFNTRRRASMIPGPWDFAGVLFANAGFILVGGPLILAGVNAGWRRSVLYGGMADWRGFSGEGAVTALGLWAIYFIAVVAGAALLIWGRRRYTVFYNVDTTHFPDALEWALGRCAVSWDRHENRYNLGLGQRGAGERPAERLTIALLPSCCNVTLGWAGHDPAIRERVERELSALLPNMRAAENAATRWLVSAATVLSVAMVCSAVLFVVLAIQVRAAG